jgi:hypothetical protein
VALAGSTQQVAGDATPTPTETPTAPLMSFRFWSGPGFIPGVGPVLHTSIESGVLFRARWFLPNALIAGYSCRFVETWSTLNHDKDASGWSAVTLIPTIGVRTEHLFSTVGTSFRILNSDQLPGAERQLGLFSPGIIASVGAVSHTFGLRLEGEVQRHFLFNGSAFTLATLGVSVVMQLHESN